LQQTNGDRVAWLAANGISSKWLFDLALRGNKPGTGTPLAKNETL